MWEEGKRLSGKSGRGGGKRRGGKKPKRKKKVNSFINVFCGRGERKEEKIASRIHWGEYSIRRAD